MAVNFSRAKPLEKIEGLLLSAAPGSFRINVKDFRSNPYFIWTGLQSPSESTDPVSWVANAKLKTSLSAQRNNSIHEMVKGMMLVHQTVTL